MPLSRRSPPLKLTTTSNTGQRNRNVLVRRNKRNSTSDRLTTHPEATRDTKTSPQNSKMTRPATSKQKITTWTAKLGKKKAPQPNTSCPKVSYSTGRTKTRAPKPTTQPSPDGTLNPSNIYPGYPTGFLLPARVSFFAELYDDKGVFEKQCFNEARSSKLNDNLTASPSASPPPSSFPPRGPGFKAGNADHTPTTSITVHPAQASTPGISITGATHCKPTMCAATWDALGSAHPLAHADPFADDTPLVIQVSLLPKRVCDDACKCGLCERKHVMMGYPKPRCRLERERAREERKENGIGGRMRWGGWVRR